MYKQDQAKYFTRNIGYGIALVITVFIGTIGFLIVEAFAKW